MSKPTILSGQHNAAMFRWYRDKLPELLNELGFTTATAKWLVNRMFAEKVTYIHG